jgi:endo-1,4-beta-xylanase
LGPDYGALAFRLARETDPGCRLVLNDYGLEADVGWQEAKRARLLSILRTWLDAGAPIDAVGVQGHLLLHDAFSPAPFAAFVRSIRALGLEVLVTELDVQEPAGPLPDIATRDAAVAERTYAFVSTALEHGVRTVLCWGLSDAQSWLNLHQPTRRADGVQVRGLPLDAGLNRKPMWDALARAFRGA